MVEAADPDPDPDPDPELDAKLLTRDDRAEEPMWIGALGRRPVVFIGEEWTVVAASDMRLVSC